MKRAKGYNTEEPSLIEIQKPGMHRPPTGPSPFS